MNQSKIMQKNKTTGLKCLERGKNIIFALSDVHVGTVMSEHCMVQLPLFLPDDKIYIILV